MSGRRGAALVVVAAIAALTCGDAGAGKRRGSGRELGLQHLPAWAREAFGRQVADDSGVDVVWLHEERIVEPVADGGVMVTRRLAGRVMRAEGLRRVDAFPVYYYDADRVLALEAWTIAPGGTVLAADPDDDVSDLPAVGGNRSFNDARVRVIHATGVVVGSTVAFEARHLEHLDVGADGFTFGADDEPTALSRYTVRVPEGWRLERHMLRADALEVDADERGFTLTAHDLPPLEDEELRPPARDLLPRAWGRWWDPGGERGFADWDAVAAWFRGLAESTLDEPGEAAAIGERLRPSSPAELPAALEDAFAFAARDVRYVAIDLGLGIGAGYIPDTPASVCDKRYGDCKDKAFLLRALTRPWQVESYPVLVRTSGLGEFPEDVPYPGQFNHCIAAVRLPDGVGDDLWSTAAVEGVGRVVFLDATVRDGSPWALRSDVQGTTALLVHPGGGTLVKLPVQPPDAAREEILFDATLGADGRVIEATLEESWTGTRATRVRRYYSGLTDEQHRRQVEEDLSARFSGASIAGYSVEGLEDADRPVREVTRLDGGRLAQRVGDLLIVGLEPIAPGLSRMSLPSPPRRWPLDLANPYEDVVRVRIRAPDGWVPEELPPPLAIEGRVFDARAGWTVDGEVLVYERRLRFEETEVAPEDYAGVREELLRVAAADRGSIVLVPR